MERKRVKRTRSISNNKAKFSSTKIHILSEISFLLVDHAEDRTTIYKGSVYSRIRSPVRVISSFPGLDVKHRFRLRKGGRRSEGRYTVKTERKFAVLDLISIYSGLRSSRRSTEHCPAISPFFNPAPCCTERNAT